MQLKDIYDLAYFSTLQKIYEKEPFVVGTTKFENKTEEQKHMIQKYISSENKNRIMIKMVGINLYQY